MNLPYAEISVNALKNNARVLRDLCYPAKFYAVIKADAYGHGLVETARIIEPYVDGFCAGTVAEGAALRLCTIEKQILCLIPPNMRELSRAKAYGLQICVQSLNALKALAEYSYNASVPDFHLAVNTGMNRLGIEIGELDYAVKIIKNRSLPIKGVFSHFYDALDYSSARAQFDKFAAVAALKSEFNGLILHISSGAGLSFGNEFKLDAVRVGLALYGYPYANEKGFAVKRAMKIYAPVLQNRRVFCGEHMLYGDFSLNREMNADIISYGYYNGLFKGMIGEINAPCMNLSAVERDFSCEENPKNSVCVLNNAEYAARASGLSVYNVLTSASGLRKIYLK